MAVAYPLAAITSAERDDADVVRPRDAQPDASLLNATQLSVPILIVIAMVVSAFTAAISASGVYWMMRLNTQESQYQMQSDLRDIKTRMETESKILEANERARAAERQSERQSAESTKQSVDTLRGAVQLMQMQVADLLKQRR